LLAITKNSCEGRTKWCYLLYKNSGLFIIGVGGVSGFPKCVQLLIPCGNQGALIYESARGVRVFSFLLNEEKEGIFEK